MEESGRMRAFKLAVISREQVKAHTRAFAELLFEGVQFIGGERRANIRSLARSREHSLGSIIATPPPDAVEDMISLPLGFMDNRAEAFDPVSDVLSPYTSACLGEKIHF